MKLLLRLPKGRKAIIQDYAAAIGESVNSYINGAIDDRMAQEADGPVCMVPVSLVTFYAATEAADAHGESVNGFINRAIIETIDRDQQAPPPGVLANLVNTLSPPRVAAKNQKRFKKSFGEVTNSHLAP